jgi:hypothetical protein
VTAIYGLLDPETRALRYIGKANKPRARLATHLRESRRRATPVACWVRSLTAKGMAPEMVVLEEPCADWIVAERRWIARAREMGVNFLNLAEGGDQPHCPREVRSANAKKSNAARNPTIRWIQCQLGKYAKAHDEGGRPEKAAKLRQVLTMIRGMTKAQQDQFAADWVRRDR